MKLTLKKSLAATLFCASVAPLFAGVYVDPSYTTFKYYTGNPNSTNNMSTWGQSGSSDYWSPTGAQGINDNVVVDFANYMYPTRNAWANGFILDYWLLDSHASSKLNSLTIKNLYDPSTGDESTGKAVYNRPSMTVSNQITGHAALTITQDLNYETSVRVRSAGAYTQFILGAGCSDRSMDLKIGRDINVGSSNSKANEYGELFLGGLGAGVGNNQNGGLNSLQVAGDVNIYGNGALRLNAANRGTLQNPAVVISGFINFSDVENANTAGRFQLCSAQENYETNTFTSFIKVRGIKGNSKNSLIDVGTDAVVTSYATLIIDSKAGDNCEYMGKVSGATSATNNISIIKTGAEDSVQKLRNNVYTRGTIEVQSGTLIAKMYGGIADLKITGGAIGATSLADNEICSDFGVKNFVYGGGKILIKIIGEEFDKMTASAKLSIENTDTILIDFTASDINADKSYDIMAWNSKDTSITSDTFSSGGLVEDSSTGLLYEAIFTATDKGLTVSFTLVPEPSTYAAIFGALALGFALWRRRK